MRAPTGTARFVSAPTCVVWLLDEGQVGLLYGGAVGGVRLATLLHVRHLLNGGTLPRLCTMTHAV